MWTLPKFQDFSQYDTLSLDTETTGLNPWSGNKVVGVSISTGDRHFYYPFGHKSGNQYSRKEVLSYIKRELRSKKLILFNGKFDLLFLLLEGVDLRNNDLYDGILAAPLINEFEPSFSLDSLCDKYLGERKIQMDAKNIHLRPSNEVGPYAERDALLHYKLHKFQEVKLTELDLWDVYNLERKALPVTIEMEYNGLPIDEKKLYSFEKGINSKLNSLLLKLKTYDNSQLEFIPQTDNLKYKSPKWLEKIFKQENIPFLFNFDCPNCKDRHKRYIGINNSLCPFCEAQGEVKSSHFGDEIKRINHKFVQLVIQTKKYDRLLNNFIIPWKQYGNVMRYNLHQLRGDEYGTISGRYSCSSVYDGAHPQQIWKPENQIDEGMSDFILRELFTDEKLFSADASQIEYRLFAHYSGSRNIIGAYNDDPNTDYHQYIADNVFGGKLQRHKAKHPNFGKIYGLGAYGLAKKLNCTTEEAREINEDYDRKIPEVKRLTTKIANRVKSKGYVKTLYRRKAYIESEYAYRGVNRVIQGGAAEVLKERLTALFDAKLCLIRLTIHDEVIGREDGNKDKIKSCLESFTGPPGMIPLRVPIIWNIQIGNNWAMR